MLMIKYQKRMIRKKAEDFFVGFENDLLLRIIGPQSPHKARPWWIQNAPWWSMATLLALRNHLPSSELTRQWIFFHCYVSCRGKNKFLVSSDSRLPKIDISLTLKVSFNKIWGKRLSPCNLCGHLANQLVGWKSPKNQKILVLPFGVVALFLYQTGPRMLLFGAPRKKKKIPSDPTPCPWICPCLTVR